MKMLMALFESWSSDVGNDRSANCATTTACLQQCNYTQQKIALDIFNIERIMVIVALAVYKRRQLGQKLHLLKISRYLEKPLSFLKNDEWYLNLSSPL